MENLTASCCAKLLNVLAVGSPGHPSPDPAERTPSSCGEESMRPFLAGLFLVLGMYGLASPCPAEGAGELEAWWVDPLRQLLIGDTPSTMASEGSLHAARGEVEAIQLAVRCKRACRVAVQAPPGPRPGRRSRRGADLHGLRAGRGRLPRRADPAPGSLRVMSLRIPVPRADAGGLPRPCGSQGKKGRE